MATERLHNPDRADALRETLIALFDLVDADNRQLHSAVSRVPPEDVAAVLGDFDSEEKLRIYHALPSNEARGIVIEETDQQSQREILEDLDDAQQLAVLGEMPVDELVDHLETLPDEQQAKVIASLEAGEAKEVEELLAFAPDTAGGMMTTEVISIPLGVTSREALEKIQGNLTHEVIAYVYVVDPQGVLRGVASIRDILAAKPDVPLESYIKRDVIAVGLTTDREEVAALVDKYNLAVLPVVDDAGHVKGLVTFDDVFDAVQEEHSEDMLRMAGTVAIHPFYEPVHIGVIKRLPFLLLTMLGGFGILLAKVMFDPTIPPPLMAVSLAMLPLLIGLTGNVAIVTSTIVVRGLATGEINPVRVWRALGKEMAVGTSIGLILALVVTVSLAVSGWTAYEIDGAERHLRWIPALALCASITFSAFLGGIIPVLCRLSGVIDPAIASGPFVTMLADLSSTFIFLSLIYLHS